MIYSFETVKDLIKGAEALADQRDSAKTILFLSCVSTEISLCALLDESGFNEDHLKEISKDIRALLKQVCFCTFKNPEKFDYGPKDIRSLFTPDNQNGSVFAVKYAEFASQYDKMDYEEHIKHFSPAIMLSCAKQISDWCFKHRGQLKINPTIVRVNFN